MIDPVVVVPGGVACRFRPQRRLALAAPTGFPAAGIDPPRLPPLLEDVAW